MKIGNTPLIKPLRYGARVASFLSALFLLAVCALHAQQVGKNVNMVTGTQWPGGDPFLQRQNEPSMAVSSRNPLHMVAGDNDYRSVDLPFVSGAVEPTGDAWLGFFTSFDGGQTWTSNLVPGYPQDTSLRGRFSPIHGLGAAADPTVRAGTNGMFYYSGLAFDRQAGGANKVFVATYTDDNNLEGGNSIRYLWTTTVDSGTSNLFEDKPSIAVDIPRSWSGACIVPALPLKNTQIFRAGTVYAAWTQFTGDEANANAAIWYSHSIDCGLTWSHPQKISGTAKTNQGAALAIDPNTGALYVTWRVFASTNPIQADAIMYTASFDGGNTFTKPALVANISPFDQGETSVSFRTNDYPTIAVDGASHVYLAWTQRGVGNVSTTGGDARIVVATGTPTSNPHKMPLQWSAPLAVDPWSNRGHQIIPAIAFSAGKLTVAWYDLRNDDLLLQYNPLGGAGQFSETLANDGGAPDFPAFGIFIQDPVGPPFSSDARRQTLDVRSAQALPGNPPTFFPSVQVSDYPYGSVPASTEIQQLQVDPPNLPLFQSGTLPFFGDYVDVAGPTFIPNKDGTWRFNNQAADPDFTHVVWADNRDVVPPADGNWANYTPPTYGTSTTSIFDPTQQRPACTTSTTGNTGDRNQNIYTAQLAPGVVLSAPGNAKPLGTGPTGQLIQRQFAIVVANTTDQTRDYELTVNAQPTGGVASFLQFPASGQNYPLTQIQVEVPPLSSTSRSLFVTSTVANATVTVSAAELTALNGFVKTGGETGSVTINGDPNNPPSANSKISSAENYTPSLATPNIANPNIANPNIANPNIANPNIANPNIANPNIANPNIANPNIANPNIANPNIANPNIANTDLSDGTVTDGTWAVTNMGNTSGAYSVNLSGQNPPPGVALQLIVYQNYTTPLAQQCTLAVQSHFVPVANITNVTFATLSQLLQPAANNPTLPGLALAPGQTAYITLRAFDSMTSNPAQALLDYNPITQTSPIVVSQGANTGTTQPPVTLTILTRALPQATLTGTYPSQTLQATGGSPSYTWSIFSGTPPAGITLNAAGVLSGIPTGIAGTSSFTVQVKDTAGNIAQQPLTIVVNPVPAISPASVPGAMQNTGYSQIFSVNPGTGTAPFAWSALTPPSGLTLAPASNTLTATLSGAPTSSGSFPFTAKVTDANGVTGSSSYTLVVVPTLSSITVTPGNPAIAKGLTQQFAATGTYSDNSTQNLTSRVMWTAASTPSGVASITPAGLASGLLQGTSTITATLGSVTGSTVLTVTAPVVESINVAPAQHTSFTGDTVWTNYDWPGQGTVLYSGGSALVAGAGTTFNASDGGVSVNVTGSSIVLTFPNGWGFNPATVSLDGLAVTDPLATITGATFASSNIPGYTGSPSQLSFDGHDVYINFPHPDFSSLAAGATVSVNVQFAGSPLSPPYAIPVDTTQQFTATGVYSDTTMQGLTGAVTWGANSTSAGVASITSGGLVSGVTLGSSAITATAGLVTGSTNLTVAPPALLSIAVTPSFPPAIVGTNTQQFTAVGTYTDSTTQTLTNSVTWASSATGVATITSGGLAAGVAPGTTTISATLSGIVGTMHLAVNATPSLIIGTTSVPNGQFNSPYAPTTLSASGGTAPYTFSLGAGGVLPVHMTLDPSGSTCGTSNTICGTPAQAGLWNVPLVVTDSSSPHLTQTATVPLTINLATGYAGGTNCYMPYPATPLYYLGASGLTLTAASPSSTMSTLPSEGSSALIASQMTFIQGNILTGCLTGRPSNPLTSGVYTLTFNITGTPSMFNLPMTVVGQDTQDNGTVSVNSGGVGTFPPTGFQQGVVTTGTSFNYLPGIYGLDPGVGGQLLFGFSGMAPQVCSTSAGLSDGGSLTAPTQAGRYDILLDSSPGCPASVFPVNPVPIVFESADVIGTTVSVPPTSGATITNVVLSGLGAPGASLAANNVLEFESGSSATIQVGVSFNYSIMNTACPGCIDQIAVGLNTDPGPQVCPYFGIDSTNGASGSANITINVPNSPGRYYIGFDRTEQYSCVATWPSGMPGPSQYIGIVDVWPH